MTTRFADGSVSNQRMASAAVRATESWQRVIRRCDKINEEMDEVTPPLHAFPIEVHDEDSAVIAVANAIEANEKAEKKPPTRT